MYRNSEHYPDPTAGTAIARITDEEKKAKKKIRTLETPTYNIPEGKRWLLVWVPEIHDEGYQEINHHEQKTG